jgi:hypothetical protein
MTAVQPPDLITCPCTTRRFYFPQRAYMCASLRFAVHPKHLPVRGMPVEVPRRALIRPQPGLGQVGLASKPKRTNRSWYAIIRHNTCRPRYDSSIRLRTNKEHLSPRQGGWAEPRQEPLFFQPSAGNTRTALPKVNFPNIRKKEGTNERQPSHAISSHEIRPLRLRPPPTR